MGDEGLEVAVMEVKVAKKFLQESCHKCFYAKGFIIVDSKLSFGAFTKEKYLDIVILKTLKCFEGNLNSMCYKIL